MRKEGGEKEGGTEGRRKRKRRREERKKNRREETGRVSLVLFFQNQSTGVQNTHLKSRQPKAYLRKDSSFVNFFSLSICK
jgi:hypothetical protein